MAQIQDRKSNFYSQNQSVRDESGAPQYLESAGDILIKNLARKQTQTSTTLEEQLQVVQNFEKGFELSPDTQGGVASLKDFQKNITDEKGSGDEPKTRRDLEELMTKTGLTRHELELSFCEKPNSTISQLYKFAIENKVQKEKKEGLESKLPDHPINRLKEIEEECFGYLKRKKPEKKPQNAAVGDEEVADIKTKEKRGKKNKKHRKRRKKSRVPVEGKISESRESEQIKFPHESHKNQVVEENFVKASSSRPSLWDVKDMKKWSEGKTQGCQPPALYTIQDGKIIKLSKSFGEDIT